MNIAELIQRLSAGANPDNAVLASADPSGSSATPASTLAPPPAASPQMPPIPDNAPVAQRTPLTNPQNAQDAPKITQSPPDLANMYLQLMRQNQNAEALDSGLTMIAAGLSHSMDTRKALLGMAGDSGTKSRMTASDFANLQKLQQEQQNYLLRQAAKAGLMKKYNLDKSTVDYLDSTGKLDDVIKHHNTQNLTVVEHPDGTKAFHNPINGALVAPISGEPPPRTEVVTDQNTGRQSLVNKDTGEVIKEITGATKQVATDITKDDATGEQNLINKGTGEVIKQVVPPRQPGQKVTDDDEALFKINKDRTAAGKPPMGMEDYLKTIKKGGQTINIGPTGTPFPEPPEGYAYQRNTDNTVKVDAEGKPKVYALPDSPQAQKEAEKNVARDAATQLEQTKARQKYAQVSTVVQNADDAIKMLDEPHIVPRAGMGSGAARSMGLPGPTDLVAKIRTIDANTAFQQLQAMRDASPTGGALGQVSDFENRMLSSTIANLDPAQSEGQLRKQLQRVRAAMIVLAENNFKGNIGAFNEALNAEIAKTEKKPAGKYGVQRIETPITP